MADAATEFLLNNLKELVLYEAHLINDTEGNIKKLESDLLHFQAFLKDTVKMRKSNERIKQMRKEIHNVVYDVEDIIDAFMVKNREAGKSNRFIKKILTGHKSQLNLLSIGQKVEEISGRITQLRNEINLTTDDDDKKDIPSEVTFLHSYFHILINIYLIKIGVLFYIYDLIIDVRYAKLIV